MKLSRVISRLSEMILEVIDRRQQNICKADVNKLVIFENGLMVVYALVRQSVPDAWLLRLKDRNAQPLMLLDLQKAHFPGFFLTPYTIVRIGNLNLTDDGYGRFLRNSRDAHLSLTPIPPSMARSLGM